MIKRFVPILILFFLLAPARATDYYFSTLTGASDGNNGLTALTPKTSLSAMLTVIAGMQPGDILYLERGSIWYEVELDLSNISGTSASHITISAYGTGEFPILSGEKIITATPVQAGNVYTYTDSDIGDVNISSASSRGYRFPGLVTIDGVREPISRYPDGNSYLYSTGYTSTSITDAEGWTTNQWQGAMVGVRPHNWQWDVVQVVSNTSTTLTTTHRDLLMEPPGGAKWYYFMNHANALSTNGEWATTDNSIKIYSSTGAPTQVKVSIIDTIINIEDANYWDIEYVELRGGNMFGAHVKRSDYITFDHVRVSGIGFCGLFFWGVVASPGGIADTWGCTVTNSELVDCLNNSILFKYCTGGTITNNYIHRSGLNNAYHNLPEADLLVGSHLYATAVQNLMGSDDFIMRYNYFDSIGAGIVLNHLNGDYSISGTDFRMEYNYISNYGMSELADLGAYYCVSDPTASMAYVRYNFILDVHNPYQCYTQNGWGIFVDMLTHAVYWDTDTYGQTTEYNSIENCNIALMTNGGRRRTYRHNKILNPNSSNLLYQESHAQIIHHAYGLRLNNHPTLAGYDTIASNTFVLGANKAMGYAFNIVYSDYYDWIYPCSFPQYSYVDSNSWFDPNTSSLDIARIYTSSNLTYGDNLAEWAARTFTGCDGGTYDPGNYDTYSNTDYVGVKMFKNFSNSAYTFNLSATYVTEAGAAAGATVTVPAFYSTLLFATAGDPDADVDLYIDTTLVPMLSLTTPAPPEADTCDSHITIYDTINTADSVGWYFNNNLNTAYGDYTLNYTGTVEYTYNWECEGTYQLHENTLRLYTNSAVNLADSFHVKLCYGTFTTTSWKTIVSNTYLTGPGWLLQRGTNGRLVFITNNGSGSSDSSFTVNGAVGTIYDQDSYQIEIIVNRTAGYASILVDGIYVTASDSSIRTDFETNATVSIYDDAGGQSKAWSYLDKIELKWRGQTISSYDSCITATDTLLIADTLKAVDIDLCYRANTCVLSYSAPIADSIQGLQQDEYIVFYNVDFGVTGANRARCHFITTMVGSEFEIRSDSLTGPIVTTFVNPDDGIYNPTLQTKEISQLTGLHDIYLIGSDLDITTIETMHFAWLLFYNETLPTGTDEYFYCPDFVIGSNWHITY